MILMELNLKGIQLILLYISISGINKRVQIIMVKINVKNIANV